jgi:hypothetical protein
MEKKLVRSINQFGGRDQLVIPQSFGRKMNAWAITLMSKLTRCIMQNALKYNSNFKCPDSCKPTVYSLCYEKTILRVSLIEMYVKTCVHFG